MKIIYDVQNISEVYEDYVYMSKYKTLKYEYKNCKYCGTTNENKFKSRAHLVPEFTGNRDFFLL